MYYLKDVLPVYQSNMAKYDNTDDREKLLIEFISLKNCSYYILFIFTLLTWCDQKSNILNKKFYSVLIH